MRIESNFNRLVAMIMQGNYVLIGGTSMGEPIANLINKIYSIPFHLSEQKLFLSNVGMPMRKSLPEKIINQINQM